jgi:hypothetical protein
VLLTLFGIFVILKKGREIVSVIFIWSCSLEIMAAPSPPGGGDPGLCFPNPCIPIDQGDFLIVGIGVLFAFYFLFKRSEQPTG